MNPFNVPGISDGVFVAAKYIRRFAAWMDGFTITADPEIIIEPRGNGIHLKIDHQRVAAMASGEAASTHPFKVSGANGVFTVQPGGITTYDGIGTVLQFIPTAPLGLPLASYVWSLSAGFTGYVVLRVKFDAETGGAITDVPWTVYFIEALASLENIPLVRYNGENDPQDGEMSIIIADVANGAVTNQRVTQSLCIYTIWNEIIFQGY